MFNNEKNLNFSIKCVKKWKQNINFLKGYSKNMNYKYIIIIHLHLVIFSIILISLNKSYKLYSSSLISSHMLHILARKEHIELTHLPTLIYLCQKKFYLCQKLRVQKERCKAALTPWKKFGLSFGCWN
jgi:hypothetical protein